MNDDIDKIRQTTLSLAKESQHLVKENYKFNASLAKMFLSLPISMNYELWCYLHSIVDGDSND